MSVAIATQTITGAPAPALTRDRAQERPAALPALTGLRIFAALAVVFSHFGFGALGALRPGSAGVQTPAEAGGSLAVSFFFILSGFILAHSYVGAGGLRGSVRAFYAARIARVYPAYLLGCGLGVAALALWGGSAWADPHYAVAFAAHPRVLLLATLTMTQTWVPYGAGLNPPAWSLGCEALFYALFPLLVRSVCRRGPRALLLGALLCWALCLGPYLLLGPLVVHLGPAGQWVLHFCPLVRLPEFGIGLCVGRWYALVRPDWGALLPGALALVAAAFLLLAHSPYVAADRLYGGPLDALCALVIVAAAGTGVSVRVLGSRLLVRLGEASYALYILHYPLWTLLVHLLPPPSPAHAPLLALYVSLYAAGALALCVLVLDLIEQPARRTLRRVIGVRPAACPEPPNAATPGQPGGPQGAGRSTQMDRTHCTVA